MNKSRINNERVWVTLISIISLFIFIIFGIKDSFVMLLAMLILIFSIVIFLKSNKIALGILLISLPMDKIAIRLGGISVTIGMVVAFALAIKLLLTGKVKFIKGNYFNKITVCMILLCISITISTIFAVNKLATLNRIFQLIILFFVMYSVYLASKEQKDIILIKIIVISGIFNLILGYMQFIGYYNSINVNQIFDVFSKLNNGGFYGVSTLYIGTSVMPRMNGFFLDPSPFAGFMTSIFIIIFASHIKKFKKTDYLLLILFSLSIILSYSRSAWLGAVLTITITILFFNISKRYNMKKKNCALIIIVIIIIATFNDYIWTMGNRILQMFIEGDVSTEGHKNFAILAVKAFIENPLWGIGLNNFSDYVGSYAMTHSMYLTFLSETGIVGTAIFSSIWVILIRGLWKVYKTKEGNELALAILFVLISILICNIGYDYYNQMYIWGFFGLGLSIIDRENSNKYLINKKSISVEGECE